MYNEDLKNWFLEDGKLTEISKKTKLQIFKHTEKIEKAKDIDCSQWTSSEIINFYKVMSTSSSQSLKYYHSVLDNYTDFCLSHLLVPDHQNHYKEISKEVLNSCVNKIEAKAKFIPPDEVIAAIDELSNPSDQFIIRALFEGIKGDNYYDISNSRLSDIEGNKMKLFSGKTVDVSDKLVEYARKSVEATEYIPLNGNLEKIIGLIDNKDYIIKRKVNARPGTSNLNRGLGGRIRRIIRTGMGYETGVVGSITLSGIIYYVINDAKMLNIRPEDYLLNSKTRERVEERFRRIQDVQEFLNEYGEYLK